MDSSLRQKIIFPSAAIGDQRLTGRDVRVLASLCYFDPDGAGIDITAGRSNIVLLSGIQEHQVSRCLTRLCNFEWLIRVRMGHKGLPSTYRINWSGGGLKGEQNDHPITDQRVNNSATLNPTEGEQNVHPLAPKGGQNVHSERPKGEQNVHTRSDDDLDDDINNSHHQRKGEQNVHPSTPLNPEQIYQLLKARGVPPTSLANERVRTTVQAWSESNITSEFLNRAITYAIDKCKQGGFPGVPYIDRVVHTLKSEAVKHQPADDFTSTDEEEVSWAASQ